MGSSSCHGTVMETLDFSPGLTIRDKVCATFSTSVHPSPTSTPFLLVVSFARSIFRMDPVHVALALEACLGADHDHIKVTLLYDRTFQFSVFSKAIGFFIYNLKSYTFQQFKCYFHLWGAGGPNWRHEFNLWNHEEDASWTMVSQSGRSGSRNCFYDQSPNGSCHLSRSSILTGANAVPKEKTKIII